MVVVAITIFSIQSKSQSKIIQSMSLYNIEINSIDGSPIHLNEYKGKHLLFVNVASECGFTGQYEDLQKLWNNYLNQLFVD